MPKPRKQHALLRALKDHDRRFIVYENRGKGGHFMLYHPDVGGRPASVPVPRHGGKEVPVRILLQIIRRFDLPRDIFD